MRSNGRDTSSWAQEVSEIPKTAFRYHLQAFQDIVGRCVGHVLQLLVKTRFERICPLQAGTFMSSTLLSAIMRNLR